MFSCTEVAVFMAEEAMENRRTTFPIGIQGPGAIKLRAVVQSKLVELGVHTDDVLAVRHSSILTMSTAHSSRIYLRGYKGFAITVELVGMRSSWKCQEIHDSYNYVVCLTGVCGGSGRARKAIRTDGRRPRSVPRR